MTWTIIFVFIAFAIYLTYNGVAIGLFGVPNSLSETYYLYMNKNNWMKIFFPIMMMLLVALLMPAWIEISIGSDLQFLAFLAAGGIMFTGAAPAFRGNKIESRVHSTSAICAAIFALLWVFFVSTVWYIAFAWLAVIISLAILTKTLNRAKIYWLETVAFLSTFTSIIIYFLR